MSDAVVEYCNANRVTVGAHALWIADQLRAEGFRHVRVVNATNATTEDWDALYRTFRWGMGLPIE